ncbi:hypothetical protein SLS55_003001 [Diplodia seriata]|uniref:Uncharacterized protein n=1 Tax=Diplodia seriata TaxID=420778 RepID=A0ABR3CMQ8_9PEZI
MALNDDLSVLEKTWKPAGWFRELIRISLSKLQERTRKRKEGRAQPSEPGQQSQEGNATSVPDSALFCESPGALFESARELFPDLENVFNWNSADAFLLG